MQKLLIMKKRIILSVTCIVVAVIYVDAQQPGTKATSPANSIESLVAAVPPPPVPPIPPAPPPPPSLDELEPPAPPLPPVPPVMAIADQENFISLDSGPEIINSNGYEISVRNLNGISTVILKKDGKSQKIKLSTWNANKRYYGKKYGQLPPPPPSLPVIEEAGSTPPDIKKDN